MNLSTTPTDESVLCIPRASGDEPDAYFAFGKMYEYSPCERG